MNYVPEKCVQVRKWDAKLGVCSNFTKGKVYFAFVDDKRRTVYFLENLRRMND